MICLEWVNILKLIMIMGIITLMITQTLNSTTNKTCVDSGSENLGFYQHVNIKHLLDKDKFA